MPIRADGMREVSIGRFERYRLRFTAQGARNVRARIEEGAIVYENAWESTDSIITMRPDAVEEFLLVKDSSAPAEFSWRVDRGEGVVAAREDGSGNLLFAAAGDRVVFGMPRPEAVDATGQRLRLSWSWTDGALRLRVPVGVAYPLLIDPAVQTGVWEHKAQLSDRSYHGMAYDSDRKRVVLFGGGTYQQVLTDTWEWNGSAWIPRFPATRPPPGGTSLAYDPVRKRTVLYTGPLSAPETWEWDGTDWTKRTPAHSPPGRSSYAMGFDTVQGVVLLFGGRTANTILADTWSWDGTDWKQQAPVSAPAPRTNSAMALDKTAGHLVLYGGLGNYPTQYADTWEWDGSSWTEKLPATSPGPQWETAMAWDAHNAAILLVGWTMPDVVPAASTTWKWDGQTWERLWPSSSPPRAFAHRCAEDGASSTLLCFGGGAQADGNTWAWDGSTWSIKETAAVPPLDCEASATTDSDQGTAVLYCGYDERSIWTWNGDRWTPMTPAQSPPARSGAQFVFDEVRHEFVVYGGYNRTDTWIWNGSTWTERLTSQNPGTLLNPLVFDANRNRVVTLTDTTWEWDGAEWQSRATPSRPTSRQGAASAYDRARQRTVLFGGTAYDPSPDAITVLLGDTWEYDGSDWSAVSCAVSPSPRRGALAVFDTARARLAMHAGFASLGTQHELWEYDGTSWAPDMSDDAPSAGRAAAFDPTRSRMLVWGTPAHEGYPGTWLYHTFGGACATNAQCDTGFCVDGACCTTPSCPGECQSCATQLHPGTCASATNTPDPDSCTGASTCDANGACRLTDGQPCSGASQCASGHCVDGVCCGTAACGTCQACNVPALPGTCVGIASAEDPDSCHGDQRCDLLGACKLTEGRQCVQPSECASGHCVDGVCCDTPCIGACAGCSATVKGNGSDGECGFVVAGTDPADECVDEGASTCGNDGACNGLGGCRLYGWMTPCGPGICNDGTNGLPSKRTGKVCDGLGSCLDATDQDCGMYRCNGDACCTACTDSSQCLGWAWCDNGACVIRQAVGSSCNDGSQCSSGFCVDGLCCNESCDGSCRSCLAAHKASGEDGLCGPVKQGSDPASECEEQPSSTCGRTGECDGSGACQVRAVGLSCGQSQCNNDVLGNHSVVTGDICDGVGACSGNSVADCGLYRCAGNGCASQCTDDSKCVTTAWCNSQGHCQERRANGQPCEASGECMSGFCTDGVCCEDACSGQCEACNLPQDDGQVNGKCLAVAGPPRGKRPPCDASDKECGGTCDGASRTLCAYPDATRSCGAPTCSEGAAHHQLCNGKGSCAAEMVVACGKYACGNAGCKTSCDTDSDCGTGFRCLEANHQCVPAVAACDGDHTIIAADGTTGDCSPYRCEPGASGGVCLSHCRVTTDCIAGFVCDTGQGQGVCVSSSEQMAAEDSGCSCSTPGRPRNSPWRLVLIVGALGAALSRSRGFRLARRDSGSTSGPWLCLTSVALAAFGSCIGCNESDRNGERQPPQTATAEPDSLVVRRAMDLAARDRMLNARFSQAAAWTPEGPSLVSSGWLSPGAMRDGWMAARVGQRATDETMVGIGRVDRWSLKLVREGANPRPVMRSGRAVVFDDAWSATDLVILANEKFYEELLVLRDESAPRRFSWTCVTPPGLHVRQDGDGGCSWRDDRGTIPFRLARPIAIDSAGESREARVACSSRGFSVEVDADGAAWPVLLDPSIETGVWARAEEATPMAAWHGAAYDSVRGKTVVFGGMLGAERRNDTWEWDGVTWSKVQAQTRPLPRGGGVLAFDADRGRTVLFGGHSGNALSDTWEFDGAEWTRKEPAHSPSARFSHGMVYHAQNKRVLLFGGMNNSNTPLNDTWEWDGIDWIRRTPPTSPTAVYGHQMAFDAARGKTILFGGNQTLDVLSPLGSTWEWDGATWAAKSPDGPPIFYGAAAYDPTSSRVISFGGFSKSYWFRYTLAWDGASWVDLNPTPFPIPRAQHSMTLDASRQRLVVFGGRAVGDIVDDTWEWNGAGWEERSAGSHPGTRLDGATAFDSIRNELVMFGGSTRQDTLLWDGTRWRKKAPPVSPSARSGAAMVFDTSRGVCVLFGGGKNDTWEWNGTNWFERSFSVSPDSRSNHAMAFDQARNVTVLFGGEGKSDTWEYDGQVWAKKAPAHSPGAVNAPLMSYDAARASSILFAAATGETWGWDGSDWVSQPSDPESTPGTGAALTFDSARSRLVLFGGGGPDVNFGLGDTYESDGTAWRLVPLSGNIPRRSHVTRLLAFDAARRRTVLYGGWGSQAFGGHLMPPMFDLHQLADTWEYHAFAGACSTAAQCDTDFCVDGVCCEDAECSGTCRSCDTADSPGKCALVRNNIDPDSCSGDRRCDSYGTCKLMDGQPCSAGSDCLSNHCVDGVCCSSAACGTCQSCAGVQPGTCAPITMAIDPDSCAGTSRCDAAGSCKLAEGQPCSVSSECATVHCVEGVCCNSACSGPCASCTASGKGAGQDGACGFVVAGKDPDDNCQDEGAASCGADGWCDGYGGCRLHAAMTPCTPASCTDQPGGLPSKHGGSVCDGFGKCVAFNQNDCGLYRCLLDECGASCSTDAQCLSRAFCSAGSCVPRLDLGVACNEDGQCTSGFCADGVCCNERCNGTCRSCRGANQTDGVDGVCGASAADTDPDEDCVEDSTGGCGPTGVCNGMGSCRLRPAGYSCGASICTDSASGLLSVVVGQACDGFGGCNPNSNVDCQTYRCDGDECASACTTDSQCVLTAFCSADGRCEPKQGNGEPCQSASSCGSGRCVDGVCCERDCDGQCEACDAADDDGVKRGRCKPVSGPPTGGRAQCANAGSECGGTCDGEHGAACVYPVSPQVCGTASCADGKSTRYFCDGQGNCGMPHVTSCGRYACGPDSCRSTCDTDSDCTSLFQCNPGNHQCVPAVASCDGDHTIVAPDGTEGDCSPYLCESVDGGGVCRTSCRLTTDCTRGSGCDTQQGDGVCVSINDYLVEPVQDSGGCGCEVPGGNNRGKARWTTLLVQLALLAGIRRRTRYRH